jgi:transcriptional regulator with XRE-family HTH domain
MISQVLKRLRSTNQKLHKKILQWFSNYEYRANVFVDEFLAQLSENLETQNVSDSELAKKAGVNKSAVSQFFNSNSNVKVKTLFKYADAIGLSMQSPKLINFDVDELYSLYEMEVSSPSKFYTLDELKRTKSKISKEKDSITYKDFRVKDTQKSKLDYKRTG